MTSIIPSVSQANALNGRVRLLNTWIVEIGCSTVATPFVEVMRLAVGGVDVAARTATVVVAHDQRAVLAG